VTTSARFPRSCPRCKRLLGEEGFAADRYKASGRKSLCKACDREKARRCYAEHREERLAKLEAKRREADVSPRGRTTRRFVPTRELERRLIERKERERDA
jgi:hypothetical protein